MLDLTFGPSFKVKQWITGFGELSSGWIQICIGSVSLENILVTLEGYITEICFCAKLNADRQKLFFNSATFCVLCAVKFLEPYLLY